LNTTVRAEDSESNYSDSYDDTLSKQPFGLSYTEDKKTSHLTVQFRASQRGTYDIIIFAGRTSNRGGSLAMSHQISINRR
jgi:hypothetical protein